MQPKVDRNISQNVSSIGERIVSLRQEQRLSQAQLADLMGVSRQAVSKWESDQTSPDTLRLIRLADVLKTDVEYLATGVKPVYETGPVVVNVVEKVDKIIEKVVEKPKIHRVIRIKYRQNPVVLILVSAISLLLGILIGCVL